MDDLLNSFANHEVLIMLVWLAITAAVYLKGYLRCVFGLLSFALVIPMTGFVFLIELGILGFGFSSWAFLPDLNHLLGLFLLFFVGIPIAMLTILISYLLYIHQTRDFRILPGFYVANSLFVLWSVWSFHAEAIASV